MMKQQPPQPHDVHDENTITKNFISSYYRRKKRDRHHGTSCHDTDDNDNIKHHTPNHSRPIVITTTTIPFSFEDDSNSNRCYDWKMISHLRTYSRSNGSSSFISFSAILPLFASLLRKMICIVLLMYFYCGLIMICTNMINGSHHHYDDDGMSSSSTGNNNNNNNGIFTYFASAHDNDNNHINLSSKKSLQQQMEQIQQQLLEQHQKLHQHMHQHKNQQTIIQVNAGDDSNNNHNNHHNSIFQQLWKTMQEQFTSLSEHATTTIVSNTNVQQQHHHDRDNSKKKKNDDDNDNKKRKHNTFHQMNNNMLNNFFQQHQQATLLQQHATGPGYVTYHRRKALYHNSIHYHYSQQEQRQHSMTRFNRESSIQAAYTIYTNHDSNSIIHHGQRRGLHRTNHNNNKKNSKEKILHDHYHNRMESRSSLLHVSLPTYPNSYKKRNKELIKSMFQHAYDSYMYHGYPLGEVKPLSCQPHVFDLIKLNALTLIDSLDSLLIIGNNVTEFARSIERLRYHHMYIHPLFQVNENVSVFETNIRVVGGLLSAHLLALAYELHTHPITNTTQHIYDDKNNQKKKYFVFYDNVFDHNGHVKWGYNDYRDPIDYNDDRMDDDDTYEDDDDDDDCSDSYGSYSEEAFHNIEGGNIKIIKQQEQSHKNCHNHNNRYRYYNYDITNQCPLDHISSGNLTKRKLSSAHDTTSNSDDNIHKDEETKNMYWIYDGFLLELAIDMGNRLLPAFMHSKTGIPYGTVNLLYGVPADETTVASVAGGGTLSIEFELLSRLSNNPIYGQVAQLATKAIWVRHSNPPLHLFGKHIDIQSGYWVETLSGIGSNSDSFIEYLAKHSMLFPEDDNDFWTMLQITYQGIHDHSRAGEWYVDTDMSTGSHNGNSRKVFESLAAFYPGLQVLLGELAPAGRTLNSMFTVRELLGFLPERFNFGLWNFDGLHGGAAKHPLRPELLESCYFMHRATRNIQLQQQQHVGRNRMNHFDQVSSGWQWAADFALHKLNQTTQAKCGYASIQNISPRTTGTIGTGASSLSQNHFYDEMPSFFLSETLKYLYLTFDDDDESFIHSDVDREWIFTTEAHPFHHIPKLPSSSTTSTKLTKATRRPKKPETETMVEHSHKQTSTHMFRDEIAYLERILAIAINDAYVNGTNTNRRQNAAMLFQYDAKWTDSTNQEHFKDKINDSLEYISSNRKKKAKKRTTESSSSDKILLTNRKKRGYKDSLHRSLILAPYVGPNRIRDAFHEIESKTNAAHLSYENLSLGNDLRTSCPNLYSTDNLWIQALNGGSLDYSDMYISVSADAISDHPESFTLLGAAEALGLLGTGLYHDEVDDMDGLSCSSMESTSSDNSAEKDTAVAASESADSEDSVDPDNVVENNNKMVVSSDVGNFEIGTSRDGSGFVLKRLNDNEKITANFIRGEMNTNFNLAVIHSELRLPVTEETVDENKESILHKNIVITDFDGNSFSCVVELIDTSEEPVSDDVVVLASFPCAPAMYGKTNIAGLKLSRDGILLEAKPIRPSKHNPMGCGGNYDPVVHDIYDATTDQGSVIEDPLRAWNVLGAENELSCPSTESEENHTRCSTSDDCIIFVHRGSCTFYEKTINGLEEMNARGVVVINDVDHEIFLMANAGDEEEKLSKYDDGKLPLTVLITQSAGQEILDIIHDYTQSKNDNTDASKKRVSSRIVLKRKVSSIDQDTGQIINDANDLKEAKALWPVIRVRKHAMQILAPTGWGVEAFQAQLASNEQNMNSLEWQLQLLRHTPVTVTL